VDVTLSSSKLFLSNIAVAILSFLALVVFARELSPTLLGAFFLFEAILLFTSMFFDVGIRGALEKRISEGMDPGTVYTTALSVNFVTIGIACIGIFLFRSEINEYIGVNVSELLILGVVLYSVSHLHIHLLAGKLRPGETASLRFIHYFTWFFGGFILLHFGFGVRSIIYSYIGGIIIQFFIGIWKETPPIGFPSLNVAYSLVDFGKYYLFSNISRYLYNWTDVLIIGLLLTTTEVGEYEVAWRIAGVTILLSSAVGTAIFPKISALASSEDTKEIRNLTRSSIIYSTIVILPALFATIFLAQDILSILFGQEYISAAYVLIILLIGRLFQGPLIVLEKIVQGIDSPEISAKINIFSAVFNILLNCIFIWSIGLVGAAIATSIAYGVSAFFHYRYVNSRINVSFPKEKFVWVLISSSVMTVIIYGINRRYAIEDLAELGIVISIGMIIYFIILLLRSSFRNDLLTVLDRYKNAFWN